ncbi:hypothetical protein Arub01_23940 [Actinomadura rubrobrunea]|uniref:Uncharacterized protein n=1 Tax=Actinomadura rubrobrunea TaxID=115335 RepID=A0A9W6PTF0_9ACTN|nr:hypothetical protein [Actinomadura rubrobrunea]GLW64150.1 hypothetical protein Arub01_23940 [Actinomadura rubrobrunea]
MYCSTCGDERLFEQPPCPDGHGADCPERVCTECGAALLVGLPAGSAGTAAPSTGASAAPASAVSAAPAGTSSDLSATGRVAYQRAVA